MLSLSTAFFDFRRYPSWPRLLAEIKKLGFSAVELSVEVPESFMADIQRSVEQGDITISSLHNYCPRLKELPDSRTVYSGYFLTSDDEEERRRAITFTARTIEWAQRLRAKAVVLHAGEVLTDPSGREFFMYINQFGREGKLYRHYYDALMIDRAKKAPRYMDILMKGLDQLLPIASDRGIVIGLENRFFLHEIPVIDEVRELFVAYKDAPLFYWHDVGHAEIFVRHGWVKRHIDFLEAFSPRMAGIHLHDVRNISDHYAPGAGEFDFSVLKPYLSSAMAKVIEAHPKSSSKELVRSIEHLGKLGIA